MIKNLKRHWLIYTYFFKNVVAETTSYRLNFILMMVIGVGWFAVMLGTYGIIFSQVNELAGWKAWEVVFLVSTWQFIFSTFVALFVTNLSNLNWFIRTGELDFILTKPISPLFYISANRVELGSLFSVVACLPPLVLAWQKLGLGALGLARPALYLVLVACGILLLYSLMLMISSIGFWAVRAGSVQGLFWALQEFGGYPAEIYGGTLRWVLTFIVPVAVIANFPARVMVKSLSPQAALGAIGASIAMCLLARAVFYWGLRNYKSPSS